MKRASELDTTEVVRVAAFRAALRSFLAGSDRLARESDLTPRQYLLLLMIKGAPDGSERSTISELVPRLQLAQNSVTELVQRAERMDLIERTQSGVDARVIHLTLTAEGERRLARAFTELDEARSDLRRTLRALNR
jgi:DNA-binding MarR family transcriptional regulator